MANSNCNPIASHASQAMTKRCYMEVIPSIWTSYTGRSQSTPAMAALWLRRPVIQKCHQNQKGLANKYKKGLTGPENWFFANSTPRLALKSSNLRHDGRFIL